jgi:HEAT repeat protein
MSLRLPLVLARLGLVGLLIAPWVADAQRAGADGPAARDVLAAFEKDDPGWKARMRALVRIAKLGPEAVPPLVEALENGSPTAREFAAHALGMFNDPRAKPALEKAAAADPKSTVRIYAVQALRLMGPLRPADKWEKLRTDPDRGVRSVVAGALDCKAQPSPGDVRKAWASYDLTKLDAARVGQLAPEFALTAHSGKTHRLSDYRGKKEVVLRYFKFDY